MLDIGKFNCDTFLFDLDGTIYNGEIPIGDAVAFLHALDKAEKQVFFLTNNSSKSKQEYIDKLIRVGYTPRREQIISSLDAAIYVLKTQYAGKTVFPLATQGAISEIKASGIKVAELREPADVVALCLDTEAVYSRLWYANVLLTEGVPYIATHADLFCPSDKGNMPDVGAYIAFFKAGAQREPDLVCGKPNKPVIDYVSSLISTPKDRVLMCGDRLYTDILFGINAGYKTLLVYSGDSQPGDEAIYNIYPTYTAESL
ncbi:MAG: HAD-IIA family hydrolase [Christensenellaceae bacterium]|jgi:HAD superfamily hydrolase (TIGR01450 family)|nr:HAD-IIA family hydrolase [Christensenellaceae bacterium]